jgi:MoxR-like ATPase
MTQIRPFSNLTQITSAKTGLPTQKLVLYCRPTFHEQFKFLRERAINNGVLGWILGPPGTGKSATSLAFASTLDRNNGLLLGFIWIELIIQYVFVWRKKIPGNL